MLKYTKIVAQKIYSIKNGESQTTSETRNFTFTVHSTVDTILLLPCANISNTTTYLY
jgi:hypothetical protein